MRTDKLRKNVELVSLCGVFDFEVPMSSVTVCRFPHMRIRTLHIPRTIYDEHVSVGLHTPEQVDNQIRVDLQVFVTVEGVQTEDIPNIVPSKTPSIAHKPDGLPVELLSNTGIVSEMQSKVPENRMLCR